MPLLARFIPAPLVVEIERGALDRLPALLSDQRISTSGRVAVAIGTTAGPRLLPRLTRDLPAAEFITVEAASVDTATRLSDQLRASSFDAVVAVGGGKLLDVGKFAAARAGLPMVSVATNLAHDGVASPVSILEDETGRASYGVPMPMAVVIDLDEVRQASTEQIASGIGDVLSNLSAVADWELAREVNGEEVDGLSAAMARAAAAALVLRRDPLESDGFLTALAESLVLSGIAMGIAGTSRPCSGACHELSHAIDRLFPQRARGHGEQVGMGAVFASRLRGDDATAASIASCLQHFGLPVTHRDLGFTDDEFAQVVAYAPSTRPGRFTILEHLDLDGPALTSQVEAFGASSY